MVLRRHFTDAFTLISRRTVVALHIRRKLKTSAWRVHQRQGGASTWPCVASSPRRASRLDRAAASNRRRKDRRRPAVIGGRRSLGVAVDDLEGEGGEADGDVLGSIRLRGAEADPLARAAVDGLAGAGRRWRRPHARPGPCPAGRWCTRRTPGAARARPTRPDSASGPRSPTSPRRWPDPRTPREFRADGSQHPGGDEM